MDILLFLFGNWCCIGGACIVLYHYMKITKQAESSDTDLAISSDLGIILCISSLVRVYWSCSPPPIWSDEPTWIQMIAIGDMGLSAIIWIAVVFVSNKRRLMLMGRTYRPDMGGSKMAEYTSWPIMIVVSMIIAALMSFFLPTLHTHGAWPLVDFCVILNMVADGMAMLPQIVLISNTKRALPQEANHFVGLLCLGRLLRTVFWIWLIFHPDSGHAVWTFVIPDLLHTIVMGDYLYHWLAKVRRENIQPLFEAMTARISV